MADASHAFIGKPRPAVVIQSNFFPSKTSVSVCPITSEAADYTLFRVALEPREKLPLHSLSWIEIDKVTTVRRDRVARNIGTLNAEEQKQLNAALALFLGLA